MIKATSAVLIYAGPSSVDPSCLAQIKLRLEEKGVEQERIITIQDASYLDQGTKLSDRTTIIVPGGTSSSLFRELKPQLNLIRQVVQGGWNYLGFGSGALFACENLHSELKGREIEWKKTFGNYVKFGELLQVVARSPAYPVEVKTNHYGESDRIVPVLYQNRKCGVLWNEGCTFEFKDEAIAIVAQYEDLPGHPAAAVTGSFGKGNVTLSGVHPDMVIQELDDRHPELTTIEMKQIRQDFLSRLFESVNI